MDDSERCGVLRFAARYGSSNSLRMAPPAHGSTSPLAAMTRAEFEALVERALRTLPARFKRKLKNIAVVVEDWPDPATLREMEIEPPDTLYGLYRGVNLTHRDSSYGNVLPDTITIYQGPIEEDCADPDEMADLVRDVVTHEIGHYFGLDDATMEEIEEQEEE